MTDPLDTWTVYDPDRDNAKHFDSRPEAEKRLEKAREDLDIDAELYPPGELPDGVEAPNETTTDGGSEPPVAEPAEPDEAESVEGEIIDHSPSAGEDHDAEYELAERSVAEDPLDWVPGDFIDEIDGSLAINRKGFEVLSHFYGIDVRTEIEVPPEETGHEFCRATATAVTADGRECEAHGSAHVDRGDDHVLLLEMADTRARKRALSIATGVGAVAVSELKNEVTGDGG